MSPSNNKLWDKIKNEAKKKVDGNSAVYANYWLIRQYCIQGGTFTKGVDEKSKLLKITAKKLNDFKAKQKLCVTHVSEKSQVVTEKKLLKSILRKPRVKKNKGHIQWDLSKNKVKIFDKTKKIQ